MSTKAEKGAVKTAAKAEKGAVKTARSSASVTWNGGTRVYSAEIHGEDFEKLAEEFAAKIGGIVA